ncbi:hypothetical protein A2U01_0098686, partial [Trifolium medium]|nr:hypothetical protein [Trifolium medium]
RSTSSRVAPSPEENSGKQGYIARCAGPAARCTNARRLNRPSTNALRIAPKPVARCADSRKLNRPTA